MLAALAAAASPKTNEQHEPPKRHEHAEHKAHAGDEAALGGNVKTRANAAATAARGKRRSGGGGEATKITGDAKVATGDANDKDQGNRRNEAPGIL